MEIPTIALTPQTKKFWEEVYARKTKYPYWCMTTLSSPRPELIPQGRNATFGYFCRMPCLTHNVAAWGFETADHRRDFCRRYDGQVWSAK